MLQNWVSPGAGSISSPAQGTLWYARYLGTLALGSDRRDLGASAGLGVTTWPDCTRVGPDSTGGCAGSRELRTALGRPFL